MFVEGESQIFTNKSEVVNSSPGAALGEAFYGVGTTEFILRTSETLGRCANMLVDAISGTLMIARASNAGFGAGVESTAAIAQPVVNIGPIRGGA